MTSTTPTVTNVAETILRYVTAHPEACDSLEGICDWWLARQRRDDARCEVAAALQYLVARGEIEVATGPGGRTVYRAARLTASRPN